MAPALNETLYFENSNENMIYPVMALAFVVFSLFFCILMVFYTFRHEIQDMNISDSWVTPKTKKQLLLMRRRVTLKALNKHKKRIFTCINPEDSSS